MFKQFVAVAALSALAAGAAQAVTVTSVTGTGTFNNSPGLLTDGNFALGTWWTDAPNVWWQNQAGASGVALTFQFDQLYTLKDVRLGLDNNDFYALQVSKDGTTWNTLLVTLPTSIDTGYEYSGQSMIKKSSVAGEAAYSSLIDFAPVQARYARVYAVTGDSSYAVSEVQFLGTPAVPEPESYALLAAGLGVIGFVARRRRA